MAVAEQLDLGELVLIGHSMGGDVIVEAAVRLGDRVAGLVWVDTYTTLGEPQTDDEVEAFAAPFREDFATATRAMVRRLFTPDANAKLVEWEAIQKWNGQLPTYTMGGAMPFINLPATK